jgi:hypothetical protein
MKYWLFIFLFAVPIYSGAQHYYRVKADFSYKFKGDEKSGSSLVMGTAYFDKIEKKITYRVKFPRKEVWVMQDTSMYKFRDQQLVEKSFVPSPVETSIFNLALQSNMNNFGLEASNFRLESVEEDNGLVITTWIPPVIDKSQTLGKILIANNHGRLQGVVFKNNEDRVIAKQFYDDYTNVSGIDFPREITQIMYDQEGQESYQVTSYKNIIIDERADDYWYHYPVER